MAQPPNLPDTLTTFSAAAAKTSTVKLGTSIVPTYPRHPLVMAQQALTLHDLASGRLRLGIGPSHRFIIDNMYGLQHSKPLTHLREYSEVLAYCISGLGKSIIVDISTTLKSLCREQRRYQSLFQY